MPSTSYELAMSDHGETMKAVVRTHTPVRNRYPHTVKEKSPTYRTKARRHRKRRKRSRQRCFCARARGEGQSAPRFLTGLVETSKIVSPASKLPHACEQLCETAVEQRLEESRFSSSARRNINLRRSNREKTATYRADDDVGNIDATGVDCTQNVARKASV